MRLREDAPGMQAVVLRIKSLPGWIVSRPSAMVTNVIAFAPRNSGEVGILDFAKRIGRLLPVHSVSHV